MSRDTALGFMLMCAWIGLVVLLAIVLQPPPVQAVETEASQH